MKIGVIQAILAITLPTAPAFGGPKKTLPVITLRVVNEARVDDAILRKAKEEASAILGQAGVGLVWVDCGAAAADWKDREPCRRVRGRAEFWLRLTADRPAWTSKENLGFADLTGRDGSAGVYYPTIVKSAQRFSAYVRGVAPSATFTPNFLGAAIVHEVGHLILGANAHTSRGVMCAEWGREELESIRLGGLSFARDQAKLLQIEVRRRQEEDDRLQRP